MGSYNSFETFGLVDGPGIRTIVFLNGCPLRCKFCHNPEMQTLLDDNITTDEIVKKVLRSKPYFKTNGGVTISGGEPLLQYDFILELAKKLKEENIHIALDTSGIFAKNPKELLDYIDLVLLDVKALNRDSFIDITQKDLFNKYLEFVDILNKSNTDVWIRQVIIPDVNDNIDYIKELAKFLKNINNIKRVEFLPFHKMGDEKYLKLNKENPYKDKKAMDKNKCDMLYQEFIKVYKKKDN